MKKKMFLFLVLVMALTLFVAPQVASATPTYDKMVPLSLILTQLGFDPNTTEIKLTEVKNTPLGESTPRSGEEEKYGAIGVRTIVNERAGESQLQKIEEGCIVVFSDQDGHSKISEPAAGNTRSITDVQYNGYTHAVYYGYEYSRYSESGTYGHVYVPKAERIKVASVSSNYSVTQVIAGGEIFGPLTDRYHPDTNDAPVNFYSSYIKNNPATGTLYTNSHTWPYGFEGASSVSSSTGIYVQPSSLFTFRIGAHIECKNLTTGNVSVADPEYTIE